MILYAVDATTLTAIVKVIVVFKLWSHKQQISAANMYTEWGTYLRLWKSLLIITHKVIKTSQTISWISNIKFSWYMYFANADHAYNSIVLHLSIGENVKH